MRTRGSAGFTLIELLIGIVIVGILFMLGLPMFTTWMQNSQIRAAAEAIQNGLQAARGEAVRLNSPVRFTMAGPDSSWTIAQVNPAQTLQSRQAAEGSPNAVIAWTSPDPTPAALPVQINFSGLGQTDLSGTSMIQITNPAGGACGSTFGAMRCINVSVSVGGQVKLCDPLATTAGDSRKC